MRSPAEYVAAALRGLRAGPLARNAARMSHGGNSGTVTRVGSTMRGEDALTSDAPAEAASVLAIADDYPGVRKGEPVDLDGSLHIVTSTRRDASGATLTVGLSAPLDRVDAAAFSGVRREGGVARRFAHAVSLFAIRDAEPPPTLSDAAALSSDQSWSVCIAAAAWPEISDPQTGDAIEFRDPSREWQTVRLKVASAVRHGPWWMLRARPRGVA